MTASIRPIEIDDAVSFRAALDAVARERRFLLSLEAPPLEKIQAFIANNLARGHPHLVATIDDEVVGWADYVADEKESLRHIAHLGMGVVREQRGRGIGKALLARADAAARKQGYTRLELEVFADNAAAIALYEKSGFKREGVKARARYIDGSYHDVLIMAKLLD